MTPDGWKNLIASAALVVSIFALATSFTTVYFTLLRRSYLRVRFGGTLLTQSIDNENLRLMPELILLNEGARPIVAYSVTCELRRKSDNNTEQLKWVANLSTVFDPLTRGNDTRFESYPTPIFVDKGLVVSKRLQLDTRHPLHLIADDYFLDMTILSDGSSNRSQRTDCTIRINTTDIEFLKNNPPDPVKKTWRNLRFQFEYGDGMNCYITGSQV